MKGHAKVIIAVIISLSIGCSMVVLAKLMGETPSTNMMPTQAGDSTPRLRVGFINNFTETKLDESLPLDPSFNVTSWTPDTFLDGGTLNTDVLVLANVWFSPAFISGITDYLNTKNGRVFLILGGNNDSQVNFLTSLDLLSSSTANIANQSVKWYPNNTTHQLVRDINWKAFPEVQKFTNVSWLPSSINVLLKSEDSPEPLLIESTNCFGRLLVLTPWVSSTDNRDFELCLYFNYFNYHVLKYLAGQEALSFVAWPYSPVPHTPEQVAIFIFLGAVACAGIGGFLLVRRRSHRPLDAKALENVLKLGEQPKNIPASAIQALQSTDVTVKPQKEEKEDTSSEWEQVGLHRQISSFFFNMILSFLVAVPGLVMSLYIYPNFIMPYPQVPGWQALAGGFFGILGTLTDLGVGGACVKYFAEYRIKNPQKAVRFLQLLVWWMVITAVIKTIVYASVGMFVFTNGDLAYLSWICILISFQQFPGMLGILSMSLEAMQRFDYKVLCDIVGGTVVNTFINYGIILLCRSLFAGNPIYGEAFGTVVGLYVGGIVTGWSSFLMYSIAFKKLGFSVGTLLRADFTMIELKESLRYGWKLAAGSLIVPIVSTIEVMLVTAYVSNQSAVIGYWGMMAGVANFVGTAAVIFTSLKPGISEAHGNGKQKLLEYYCIEGLHYINVFTYVLFAVLIAIGAEILVGFAGKTWEPAAQYVVILCVWQLVAIYSTAGDTILQGTAFTKYNAYVWVLEQAVRAVLLFVFIPTLHVYEAIMYAAIPAVLVKEIAEYALIRKHIVRFDWSYVHNFIAPGAAAVVLYFFNWMLKSLIWQNDVLSSIVLFLTAVFSGLFLYLFLLGFFGGWDDNTLRQFERGLRVIKMVKRFFITFYKVSEYGHRCCPWKNRFPVKVYDEAMAEARALTAEKKKLVI